MLPPVPVIVTEYHKLVSLFVAHRSLIYVETSTARLGERRVGRTGEGDSSNVSARVLVLQSVQRLITFYNISLRSCGEQASEVGEMDRSLFK